MVNIVEVLSDPRLRVLALDVGSGTCGAGVAGSRGAQRGHGSAARDGHTAEDKHGEALDEVSLSDATAVHALCVSGLRAGSTHRHN